MTIKLYGIKACDTMKKARTWLDQHQIAYDFHDYKTQSIDAATLSRWLEQVNWDTLINRSGTTWRKLDDSRKQITDNAQAVALMIEQPSMIKRPVLEVGGKVYLGFKAEEYGRVFGVLKGSAKKILA